MVEDMKSKLMEMAKKKGKKISPLEGESLKNVLEDLLGQASDAMATKVKDRMQKVSVLSDSKEGLEKGLDKAKDVVKELPDGSEDESEAEDESEEEEAKEHDSMGVEPKDDATKLKELEEQIKALKSKLDSKRMI